MSGTGGAETNGGAGGGRGWLAIVALAIAAGGAGAFFLLRGGEEPPPPVETAAMPHVVKETDSGPRLPPREESDVTVRDLLSKVSSHASWAKYLELDDLLNRWVGVVDVMAEGEIPRSQLSFLAPRGQFRVVERGGKEVPDPRSHARYDAFADLVGSIDAQAFATAYSKLKGLLEPAYRAFGYPNGRFEPVMARTLTRILAPPVLDTPPELVSKGAIYEYADPKLEALSPMEKQLLRMGPRNLRIIQDKAREISAALELSASR